MKKIAIHSAGEFYYVAVDDDDFPILSRHKWYILHSGKNKRPYAFTRFYTEHDQKNGKTFLMHHLIMGTSGAVFDACTRRQLARNPHIVIVSGKTNTPFNDLDIASLEGNPAERVLATKAKVGAAQLASGFCVLLTNGIYGARIQSQVFAGASGHSVEGEAARPCAAPFKGMLLNVIAVIPHIIDRLRHAIKAGGMLIFNAVAIRQNHTNILGDYAEISSKKALNMKPEEL